MLSIQSWLDRYGDSHRNRINKVFVSAASIWEIAIEARLGKIDRDANDFAIAIEASGFKELPVGARHAAAVAILPLYHTDPFDRPILAQAFAEPLHLLTADGALAAYGGAVTVI
jgi:PIN domain nuclease of toxin-antitoxin system